MAIIFSLFTFSMALVLISMLVPVRRLREVSLLLTVSIIVGLLYWRYSVNLIESEVAVHYLHFLGFNEYNWSPSFYGGMPLFYNFAVLVKNSLMLSPESTIILFRYVWVLFSALSLVYTYSSLFPLQFHKARLIYVSGGVLAAVLLLADFTYSYLLFGDQFKQAFGMPFWFLFVAFMARGKTSCALIAAVIAVLAHHLFVIIVPVSFVFYQISKRWVRFSWRSAIALALISIISILLVQFVVTNVLAPNFFRDKLNHPVPTGFPDAFLLAPGAILATVFYLWVIFLFLRAKTLLRQNFRFRFVVIFFISLFVGSKVNLFGVVFVEPARFYSLMAPFAALGLAHILGAYKAIHRWTIICFILAYNAAFLEFARQSIRPLSGLIFTGILDANTSIFYNDISLIIYCASITMTLIIFYVFRSVAVAASNRKLVH